MAGAFIDQVLIEKMPERWGVVFLILPKTKKAHRKFRNKLSL